MTASPFGRRDRKGTGMACTEKPEPFPERLPGLLDIAGGAGHPEDNVTAIAGLLFSALDALTHALYIVDVKTLRVVIANAASRLHPLGRESTCHSATHGLERPCTEYGLSCPLREVVATSEPATAEHVHFDHQGRARICRVHCYPIVGREGSVTHVIEYNHDITELRNAHDQLRLLGTAIEAASNAIFVTDRGGRIQWVNQAFRRLSGYSSEEVVGRRPSLLASGLQDATFYSQMWATILAGDIWRGRLINRHKNGGLLIVDQTITPLADSNGELANFVFVQDDLTERAEAERRLHHAARFDYLTDLPNRHTFNIRVDSELARTAAAGVEIGVLLLDLDHFRGINETFGQTVGDALLLSVSHRLREVVLQADLLARGGGDEFFVLQAPSAGADELGALARRLLDALATPFEAGDRKFQISATVGIASGVACPGEQLLQQAGVALNRAKLEDPGGFCFYLPEVDKKVRSSMALAFDLAGALERGEIFLEFQPQVELARRTIVRVEALLRWNHPDRGVVGPSEFIDVAERNDLLEPIAEWALRSACREVRRWTEDIGAAVPVAVNVSARQLRKPGFSDRVAEILLEMGHPACLLELEVTEWVLMQEAPAVIENLSGLHALGVSLAIDDFGTGYSSIEYLRRYPFQTLKIGHRFVANMVHDLADLAIVSALLGFARRLGMRHVVEGVETEEQLRLAQAEGCDVVQGFYFSLPVSAADIGRLIREGNGRVRASLPEP